MWCTCMCYQSIWLVQLKYKWNIIYEYLFNGNKTEFEIMDISTYNTFPVYLKKSDIFTENLSHCTHEGHEMKYGLVTVTNIYLMTLESTSINL